MLRPKTTSFRDIGVGHALARVGGANGRSIAAAAKLTRGGLVTGIDSSPTMVAMARRRNRALGDAGLVDLREGDSLHLPFEDESFDGAFSVHTVYFWAAPIAHMKEVRRVLKDGGRFALGFEPESEQARQDFPASVYTFRPAEQIRQLLLSAGFRSVNLVDRGGPSRGVMFAVASTVEEPAISHSASNACRHETSP